MPKGIRGRAICGVTGCEKFVEGHGWCSTHYRRWRKYGDPLVVTIIRDDPIKRFWSYVDKAAPVSVYRPDLGRCWNWTGGLDAQGYGQFNIDGKTVKAHRWGFAEYVRPLVDGEEIDHLCRNRACVNYESHLDPVSHRENAIRGFGAAGMNDRKIFCKRGHRLVKHPQNDQWRHCPICKRQWQVDNKELLNARRRERRRKARSMKE